MKRGVGPFVAQRDGLQPHNRTETTPSPRWHPGMGPSGAFFVLSASQDGQYILPNILQLPGLECPALICCSGADAVPLPTVRALAGHSHSLNLIMALIADKHHDLHPP